MASASTTDPYDLLQSARSAGPDASQLSADGLAEDVDRRAKIAEMDDYLRELDARLGPTPDEERSAARKWADGVLQQSGHEERSAQ